VATPLTAGEGGAARPPSRTHALELMALGAGLVLVFTLAARLPSWRVELGALQGLLAVAFAFYALALLGRDRWRTLPHAGLAIVVVALAMRAAVLRVDPALSDDVFRYVWDGRVILAGHDPWSLAPADGALASLRDPEIHARINHPGLRTIYPPVAELGFALVAAVSPTVAAMKVWILLHDLALVALLAAWCAERTGSALPAIAYAWNPLVVVEYAGGGHHDPTGILWLVLALALAKRRPMVSAVAFAASVLVKLLPLVALPFLLVAWPWRARALALGLLAAGLVPFVALAGGAASGLGAYASTWRNNELFFHYAARALGDPAARALALLITAAVAGLLLWRRWEPWAAARGALRMALLTGPVLHPWYLGWTLALDPLALAAPWLVLSALALLNYGVFAAPGEGGSFHLSLGWRWVEYGVPLLLGLGLAAGKGARRMEGRDGA
jgi:hypothetical protein